MYHGKQQTNVIDHIDGNKLNNRYDNLRDITQLENCRNTHKKNKDTGHIGIYYVNRPKLLARYVTKVNGKQYWFRNIKEAISLRKENNLLV